METDPQLLPIATVERDTGLGKDTLRVWERRYGFPAPVRGANGERLYTAEQLAKLRRVTRLIDMGLRPGRIFATPESEWDAWLSARPTPSPPAPPVGQDPLLDLVRMHRSEALRRSLHQALLKEGLARFVMDTVAPLNVAVGEAWVRGELSVPDEHLYTEQVQNLLRGAIAQRGESQQPPRILLTTFPDEQHSLGLLMAEALLVSEGAQCVSLGTQTPLADIAAAARQGAFDVVALSFAAPFPLRHAKAGLHTLATQLPAVELWAGGQGVAGKLRSSAHVRVLGEIASVIPALHEWRARHAPSPA